MVKTSIDLYVWSKLGVTKIRTVNVDPPGYNAFGAGSIMSEDVDIMLHADVVTLNIHDSECEYWHESDFDEEAKMASIIELEKNTDTILQHEPVFQKVYALAC